MNIYFGGSISGGREHVGTYKKLIEFIRGFGNVLTEHIGDRSLTAEGGEDYDARYIHDRDLQWLGSADIMIAEVSTPSLGVGYEIAKAVQMKKNVLCLYHPRQGMRLSSMITGCPGVTVAEYTTLEEAKKAIHHFIRRAEHQEMR